METHTCQKHDLKDFSLSGCITECLVNYWCVTGQRLRIRVEHIDTDTHMHIHRRRNQGGTGGTCPHKIC